MWPRVSELPTDWPLCSVLYAVRVELMHAPQLLSAVINVDTSDVTRRLIGVAV